jgi:hypothetical protein
MLTIEEFDAKEKKFRLDVRCITNYYAARLKPLFFNPVYQTAVLTHTFGEAKLQPNSNVPDDIFKDILDAFYKHFG